MQDQLSRLPQIMQKLAAMPPEDRARMLEGLKGPQDSNLAGIMAPQGQGRGVPQQGQGRGPMGSPQQGQQPWMPFNMEPDISAQYGPAQTPYAPLQGPTRPPMQPGQQLRTQQGAQQGAQRGPQQGQALGPQTGQARGPQAGPPQQGRMPAQQPAQRPQQGRVPVQQQGQAPQQGPQRYKGSSLQSILKGLEGLV